MGFVTDVIHRPGHRAGSACGSFSITRMMNRSARLSSGEYPHAAGPQVQVGFERGYLADHLFGGRSFPEQDARGPSPHVYHHGQDFRAGQPGVVRHLRPRGNGLLDSCFGAAPAMEPPRDTEDHRGDSRDGTLELLYGARHSPHDDPAERIWAALKNYVANTAVTWPGRLRQVHSFFRSRSPDQMLATAAPWTSPWLPPGYEQNFWNAA